MPLDKINELSQGLTAKASPCHIPLEHKPIDFSKCVKSFLLGQTGTALQENTVKVFLGDPKHGKHNTSCWEMARHCWFVSLFTGVPSGIRCLLLYCKMSPSTSVHCLEFFIQPSYYCLRADGSRRPAPGKCALASIWVSIQSFQPGRRWEQAQLLNLSQPIWKGYAHTWWSSQTLLCMWSAACCREMCSHIPSAEQPCTKQRKEDT